MDIISQVEITSSSNIHPRPGFTELPLLPPPLTSRVGRPSPLLALACDEISGPLSYIWEDREGRRASQPCTSCSLCLPSPQDPEQCHLPESLGGPVPAPGLCHRQQTPTNVSWSRGSLTLSPSQPLDPGVLELPQVVLGDGGEVTCRAQHLSGSSLVSLNLVVLGE